MHAVKTKIMSVNYCVVRIEWAIKGYHIFRIKPHPDLILKVTHDINNQFDEHAMKVCCADIQDIPHVLLRAEAIRQSRTPCLVRDIAGELICKKCLFIIIVSLSCSFFFLLEFKIINFCGESSQAMV